MLSLIPCCICGSTFTPSGGTSVQVKQQTIRAARNPYHGVHKESREDHICSLDCFRRYCEIIQESPYYQVTKTVPGEAPP